MPFMAFIEEKEQLMVKQTLVILGLFITLNTTGWAIPCDNCHTTFEVNVQAKCNHIVHPHNYSYCLAEHLTKRDSCLAGCQHGGEGSEERHRSFEGLRETLPHTL